MPRVKTMSSKPPPKDFAKVEPTLNTIYAEMRKIENGPAEGKRKPEAVWPIMRLNHQMSKIVYDAFKNKLVGKDVLDYCIKEKWADHNLINKWQKQGYEKLCCLMCIQPTNHNFGTTCICRVPAKDLNGKIIECQHCGCRGCASGS